RIQVNGAEGTAQLDVLDLSGRVVRTSRTTLTTGSGNVLDLVGLASGTYLVRLTRNGIRNEKRLIVD
ncbi:MAG TPA: T9SS type A sorting domain-containing protein, partial [Flavobacteriales bacterium]|nr:T9SS type A sorting domain-containing protein [Flavobacteriales bacterium]